MGATLSNSAALRARHDVGRTWWPFAVAALIVAGCVLVMLMRGELTITTYKAFYCAGKVVAAGANPYLVEPLRTCEHRFFAAPTFPAFAVEPAPLPTYALAGFALLALLPMQISYAVFIALMACALLAMSFALSRLTGFSPISTTLVFLPIWAMTLSYGEIPPLAVGAIVLCALALQRKHYVVAGIFACAAMVQPHLALPLCLSLFLWVPRTRWTLAAGAAVLAAIGLLSGGVQHSIAYFTTYLPAMNASEIIATDQYSLTHLLHVAGVGDGWATRMGVLSYVVMAALGIFAARRLARDLQLRALFALTPVAFVLLGGTYLHDTQMIAAVPLLLTLLARAQRMRVQIAVAAALLCVPWTQSDSRLLMLSVLAASIALGLLIFAGQPARIGRAVTLAVVLIAAILAVNRLPAPSIAVAATTPISISADAPASSAWNAMLRASTFWSVPSARSIGRKIPTWIGLALLVMVSLRRQQRRVVVVQDEPTPPARRESPVGALGWIDAIKGVAIAWIFFNHVSERIFGAPYAGNPTASWPAFSVRIAQLAPNGHGAGAALANLARYIGWTGDQGVGLFIIVSGFLLALAHIQRPTGIAVFFNKRVLRIYPLWIGAHIAFILLWFALGKGLDPTDPRTLASVAGLRFIPSVFYYFSPAWWYVGLALQLYALFPWLASLMQRIGALRFTMWCVVVGCVVRGAGLYLAGGFVDEWSRGGIFITRLPEFALGMGLAAAYAADKERVHAALRAPSSVALAALVWIAGNAASLTLWGMSVAPLLLTAGSFVLAYAFVSAVLERLPVLADAAAWSGRHSYSLYLVHQPFLVALVAASMTLSRQLAGVGAAVAVTLAVALALEWSVDRVQAWFARLSGRFGPRGVALGTAAALLSCYVALIGLETGLRIRAPLEVFGWGERPSLQADPVVGWKLKPNQTHRLRWTGYDYVVQANALGFPGRAYPADPPNETFRVMTLGDAFTSAEGVDTAQAWPRLVERILRARTHRSVEVLNFAVTGYGPNQEAAAAREYVPVYRPKLILIGMFVNDFEDALRTNASFTRDIGFSKPPADGIVSLLELQQLKAYWAMRIRSPIVSRLRRRPSDEGAFLGNIRFFDRTMQSQWQQGAGVTRSRYAQIAALARANGGRVAVVLFPASVQVCGPGDLRYYPRYFDLENSERYQRDAPQRLARGITASLRLPFDDLRAGLHAARVCPYQRRNMHLTAYGQNVAARAIAKFLWERGLVPRS